MFFDLHNDYPTVLSSDRFAEYLNDLLGLGITATAAIWTSEFGENAVKRLRETTSRLRAVQGCNKLPIAIEDIGCLAGRDEYRTFDFSDYIYCSLTWNKNNMFAGGALDDGDLTADGKRAVTAINDCGSAVDVAHLNKKSFYSVIDNAERVLCSHTGFNGHLRSLDDEQIRLLIEKHAVIGLCNVIAFTSACSIDEYVCVIDRFVQRYGDENLSIGTDFFGSIDIPKDISDYRCFENVSHKLELLGYKRESIDKIFYMNATMFFQNGEK
ncbi:MAG: membrane dipeptidase [Clostridiales bacterium]|nr:membrane dipeptidase [Clostridiales bacterium]